MSRTTQEGARRKHGARRGRYLFAVALSLLAALLACTQSDAPIDLANITPVGDTTPVWLQGLAPGAPTVTLPPPTPPVPGQPTPTARATQIISVSPTADAIRAVTTAS